MNYWIYCKDGSKVDAKTTNAKIALQIAELYDALFFSDRHYVWNGDDWCIAKF